MLYILLSLIFGILAGALLRRKSVKFDDERSLTVPLLLLIFFMGASIGASSEVRESAILIGYQSVIFAILTVLGSVGGALLLRGIYRD
jgi:uncharacterized membrane protein YbjE (DUF340 family)